MLRRLLPSGPSLLVGFTLLALAVASYGVARETGLFAIRRIEVHGAPPDVSARVAAALEPLEGTSLVGLRATDLDRKIVGLPDVIGVTHDRAFPHTLRVYVVPERALLVLRRGDESWLVSARARVVRPLERGALPMLPRIWVPRNVEVAAGDTLADGAARRAVRVLVSGARRAPGPRPDGPARRSGDDARPALRGGGPPGPRARPPAEARGRGRSPAAAPRLGPRTSTSQCRTGPSPARPRFNLKSRSTPLRGSEC